MNRLIDRYVLSECIPALAVSLGVLSFVMLAHRMLKLSDLLVTRGVRILDVAQLLALALPSLLPLLMPASLLLAILLAGGRLSSDNEIVAMRSCGISLMEMIRPLALLSFAVFLATATVSLWLQPRTTTLLKSLIYETLKNRIDLTTKIGVFTELSDNLTAYVEHIDEGSGVMSNLFLNYKRSDTESDWILAASGVIRNAGDTLELDLKDTEVHRLAGGTQPYSRLRAKQYRLRIPMPGEVWSKSSEEQPTTALLQAVLSGDADSEMHLELHKRFAFPVSCIVFGVLAALLGFRHSRGGRSKGFSDGLWVILAYYSLLTVGKTLGLKGHLAPAPAMWLPNIVLGTAAALLVVTDLVAARPWRAS